MGMPAIPLQQWAHCLQHLAEQVDDVLGIWAPPGNALSSMQARRHVIEHASSHRQAT